MGTDRQGQFWDGVTTGAKPLVEARRLIESLIPVEHLQGASVLDAGCGAGDYSAAFGALGARRIDGFDVSQGSLRLARAKTAAGHFVQASLHRLPYQAGTFDIVWAWGMLHYVPDSAAALRELSRVLHPGGLAVIHTLRKGFWAAFEANSAKVLSRSPKWAQSLMLATGERIISLAVRLLTGHSLESSKPVRQKLYERFFVPFEMCTFTIAELTALLGPDFEVREVHPPVSDLLRRNMSITILARKRP